MLFSPITFVLLMTGASAQNHSIKDLFKKSRKGSPSVPIEMVMTEQLGKMNSVEKNLREVELKIERVGTDLLSVDDKMTALGDLTTDLSAIRGSINDEFKEVDLKVDDIGTRLSQIEARINSLISDEQSILGNKIDESMEAMEKQFHDLTRILESLSSRLDVPVKNRNSEPVILSSSGGPPPPPPPPPPPMFGPPATLSIKKNVPEKAKAEPPQASGMESVLEELKRRVQTMKGRI